MSTDDLQVHAAVSGWAADEWKRKHDQLRDLLDDAMLYAQHQDDCQFLRDNAPEIACTCGLNVWGEQVKALTGFYDD